MANNNYNLSKEYQFDITITDNTYAGKLALPYVSAAVKSPDTVAKGYVRTIDGLNRKAVISNLGISDPVQAAGCDFSTTDAPANLALTEQVLTLTDLKVNQQVCRGTIFPTWIGENMDRNGNLPGTFEDFLLSTVAGKSGEQLEEFIWTGASPFGTGFLSDSGTFNQAGLNASALADFAQATIAGGTGVTAANAVAAFGLTYDKAAETTPAILSKPGLAFYCNNKTYGFYIQQLAGQGAFTVHQGINNLGPDQSFPQATYLGIPILVCPGIPDDAIVLTYKDNLVFGTNLATDWTEARIIPTYQFDGSDNVRIVMNFAVGVQVAVKADGVVGCDF
tara:strand:+ start:151 stop:1155 length:1005 start_codon:yes stop_codon:yes gene_type:complete